MVWKIITHLQNSYVKIATIIAFPIFLLIGYIITLFVKKENKKKVWRKVAKFCLKLTFIICHIKIKMPDINKIPKGPCVFAFNHRSIADTFSLLIMMSEYFFVITKPFDAFPSKIYHLWCKNLGYIPVIRDNNDKKNYKIGINKKRALRECVKRVKNGETLVIYPEAHHERHRGFLKFKTGAVRIALEAQVPLIPGAFTGTDQVITPAHNKEHPGKIHIRLGKPMNIKKYYGKQKNHKVIKKLTLNLKKNIKRLIPL